MSDTPKYQPQTFESKWRSKWEKDQIYKTPKISENDRKHYVLDMFPYPSGAGLHVGHVEGYTATDIYSRFMRMTGHEVLHPMGFDSFGLPAENYAIKTGTHPKITTEKAIETFTEQMKAIGLSYDWNLLLSAHDPNYYKWTQWLFLLMYKRGLAYRKKQAVNWCNGCQTVLANEQVVEGKCERCDTVTIQKDMEQWFLKITDYAERLLADLDKLDWPESTKMGQRNWIGKSVGINITYPIKDQKNQDITIFTTRPDTNFGATFIVTAPNSEFVKANIAKFPNKVESERYISESLKKKELERMIEDKQKTGVFTGWYAINGLNGREMPIYIADFALANVGTGCLVGVPGHDKRDFEFAKAMSLPIVRVVVGTNGDRGEIKELTQVQEENGVMINSSFLDGIDIHDATSKVMNYLVEKKMGERITNYKLRDWLISRQRFWGTPIPMRKKIVVSRPFDFAQGKQGAGDPPSPMATDGRGREQETVYSPVPESELPVVLPMDAKFTPTGKSPLTEHPDFVGREVDTMDTFVDSSWYFLRFAQLTDEKVRSESAGGTESSPFDNENVKKVMNEWAPVDLYVGGAEHTVLHLLYARFFTKVLFDAGYVNFDEPFLKLRHQGMITGPDHRKMSKRWGNVINPLEVISEYGADTLRMYEMFMGPLDQMKPWQVDGVGGIHRFLSRVWKSAHLAIVADCDSTDKSIKVALHRTIKKLTEDIPDLKFNTAIASCMEFINIWEKTGAEKTSKADLGKFMTVLAPFAPHITEEIWTKLGNTRSIHLESWPKFDAKLLVSDVVTIPVQVNGKVRGKLEVSNELSRDKDQIVQMALSQENVKKYVPNGVDKVIYIPGKIINIIVKQ